MAKQSTFDQDEIIKEWDNLSEKDRKKYIIGAVQLERLFKLLNLNENEKDRNKGKGFVFFRKIQELTTDSNAALILDDENRDYSKDSEQIIRGGFGL
jgi:hypothetical protein